MALPPTRQDAAVDHLKQVQSVEVSCPESIILHNDRDNAGLQLRHEGIVCDKLVHCRLVAGKVKVGAPGLVVGCVCRLITVGGAVTLHAADVSIQATVPALAQGTGPLPLHFGLPTVTS